jgi:hypothetical protein
MNIEKSAKNALIWFRTCSSRFKVFTASMKMNAFWDVAPCSLAIALTTKAVGTPETSVNVY